MSRLHAEKHRHAQRVANDDRFLKMLFKG